MGTYLFIAKYFGDSNYESSVIQGNFTVKYLNGTSLQDLIYNTTRDGVEVVLIHDYLFNSDESVVIKDKVKINGNGRQVKGSGVCEIFKIEAENVEIYNITLLDGKSENGGAINWIGKNGVVDNVKFINNTAKYTAGAIHIQGDNITIQNSQFINNVAHEGGALYTQANNTIIKNNIFKNNTANNGSDIGVNANNTYIFNNKLLDGSTISFSQTSSGSIVEGNNYSQIIYIKININNVTAYVGEKFKINIKASNNNKTVNTNISMKINDKIYNITITDGVGNIVVDAISKIGSYPIEFISIDNNYKINNTTFWIEVKNNDKIIGKNIITSYMFIKNYQVQIYDGVGKTKVNAIVNFTINRKDVFTVRTNNKGIAKLPAKIHTFKPGTYIITAQYNNHKITNKYIIKSNFVSIKKITIKRSKINKKGYIILNYIINKHLSGKKINLKFAFKKYSSKVNKKGKVIFKIKKNIINKLKIGKKYKFKISYKLDTKSRTIKLYKNKLIIK